MKTSMTNIAWLFCAIAFSHVANAAEPPVPDLYINQHLGFNVKGYNYTQSSFPCDIDKHLVEYIVERSAANGLKAEPVTTADKIRNGVIPVLAMDIEQLVLGSKERTYGADNPKSTLPKVQITAAVIKGDDMVTAKHTCAIMTLNNLTPSSNVLDLGTTTTVCSATRKCLKDLSKDVVDWATNQM